MRWLNFAILSVLVLTLQAVMAPRIELFSARPDLLLIVVVFMSLYAPSNNAIAAAWVLGACADLMTIERFGLISLSYGMTAMIVTSFREYLFRYRVLTQTAVTLTACLFVRTSWMIYCHMLYGEWVLVPTLTGVGTDGGPLVRVWLISGLVASTYTAVLAPFAFHVLLRLSRPLGIAAVRGIRLASTLKGVVADGYTYARATSRGWKNV